MDHTTELVLRADRLNKPTAKDLAKHHLNEGTEVKAKKANAGSTWLAGTNTGQSLISAEAHIPPEKLKTSQVAAAVSEVELTDKYDIAVVQLASD